ncbi:Arm DNA-binding domain-containing protein, partial [Phocaeicola vulgatus]|uniref:Arm DNA-binding domain-containing protein n=1 Tax=Phocaeicola vulgatus TaxID=821 RepID=UPI0023AF5815
MEKHCTMFYFSLRESKQNKKGLSPIEVSITTNGKRIYFSTGKHISATDWNKEKQAVKGKSEEAQLINGYLIQLRNIYVLYEAASGYSTLTWSSGN